MPALDILAALLGSGRSSRLFREVREKKGLVTSADAWTYCAAGQGLFGMSAVVDADKYAVSRNALLAEVERVQREPIPAAEVAKGERAPGLDGDAQSVRSASFILPADEAFNEKALEAAKVRRGEPHVAV